MALSLVLEDALRAHVSELAGRIGERNLERPRALAEARDYCRRTLLGYGAAARLLAYPVGYGEAHNVEAVLPGSAGAGAGRLVVGAHYDTAPGTPGADDNASGVAVLLELARLLGPAQRAKDIVLVAFSTEEPPAFGGPDMGSRHYAAAARARGERIDGMLSLEMLGFYRKEAGTQTYPPFLGRFFPDRADFVAVVGDFSSRAFLARVRAALKARLELPLESAWLPRWLGGTSLSDHASFWAEGYPAVMLTDTAFHRNPHYHAASDLPDTLDFGAMAKVAEGLARALGDLAGSDKTATMTP